MKLFIIAALIALGCSTPSSPETFEASAFVYAYDFVDPQGPPVFVVPVTCTYRIDTRTIVRCVPT